MGAKLVAKLLEVLGEAGVAEKGCDKVRRGREGARDAADASREGRRRRSAPGAPSRGGGGAAGVQGPAAAPARAPRGVWVSRGVPCPTSTRPCAPCARVGRQEVAFRS